jgi:hypothetical protein
MTAREAAIARLRKIRKSPSYRSFFTDDAIRAFTDVAASAYAGKSCISEKKDPEPSR